jgi:hypothetical protein
VNRCRANHNGHSRSGRLDNWWWWCAGLSQAETMNERWRLQRSGIEKHRVIPCGRLRALTRRSAGARTPAPFHLAAATPACMPAWAREPAAAWRRPMVGTTVGQSVARPARGALRSIRACRPAGALTAVIRPSSRIRAMRAPNGLCARRRVSAVIDRCAKAPQAKGGDAPAFASWLFDVDLLIAIEAVAAAP